MPDTYARQLSAMLDDPRTPLNACESAYRALEAAETVQCALWSMWLRLCAAQARDGRPGT